MRKTNIADTLRALKIREEKSWKAMDWALSSANKDVSTKIKAAEFILKRLYPEKTVLQGDDENPIRIIYRFAGDISKPKAG